MNWDVLKGDWKQFKGKVRQTWAALTDDEVEKARGRRDQFEGVLQKRYGIARDEVKRQVDEFEKSCHC